MKFAVAEKQEQERLDQFCKIIGVEVYSDIPNRELDPSEMVPPVSALTAGVAFELGHITKEEYEKYLCIFGKAENAAQYKENK